MTAKEIILALPERLKQEEAQDAQGVFHFQIEGEGGGDFTVKVDHGTCTVEEGLVGEANCVITSTATDFEDAELGRENKQMSVMMGKIKISNLGAMLQFMTLFKDLEV
ncbi:MAG: SCP2 sterol-binding domain-containing protein [Chitinophagales bacterium]|nr:SCP2 sterol-binding domain-containing protein [Chitinophagales bacterium]